MNYYTQLASVFKHFSTPSLHKITYQRIRYVAFIQITYSHYAVYIHEHNGKKSLIFPSSVPVCISLFTSAIYILSIHFFSMLVFTFHINFIIVNRIFSFFHTCYTLFFTVCCDVTTSVFFPVSTSLFFLLLVFIQSHFRSFLLFYFDILLIYFLVCVFLNVATK